VSSIFVFDTVPWGMLRYLGTANSNFRELCYVGRQQMEDEFSFQHI
jgi:hypothetical protein